MQCLTGQLARSLITLKKSDVRRLYSRRCSPRLACGVFSLLHSEEKPGAITNLNPSSVPNSFLVLVSRLSDDPGQFSSRSHLGGCISRPSRGASSGRGGDKHVERPWRAATVTVARRGSSPSPRRPSACVVGVRGRGAGPPSPNNRRTSRLRVHHTRRRREPRARGGNRVVY